MEAKTPVRALACKRPMANPPCVAAWWLVWRATVVTAQNVEPTSLHGRDDIVSFSSSGKKEGQSHGRREFLVSDHGVVVSGGFDCDSLALVCIR